MRDRISHGYYNVDLDIVWETAVTAVPKTVAAARSLLPKYDAGDDGVSDGPSV